MKYTRSDTLPEGQDFPDTGCSEHPQCLTCPLPRCVEDTRADRYKQAALTLWERDQRIAQLRKQGVPPRELQRIFKLGDRQIQRSIQTHDRPKPADPWKVEDTPGKPVDEIGKDHYRNRKPRLRA